MLFWMVVTIDSIEVDYVVYILTRLPLISQHLSGWCTKRVTTRLVYYVL